MTFPPPSQSLPSPASVLVVGAGGHGLVVAELARACGYSSVDFADDRSAAAVCTLDGLPSRAPRYGAAAVGIGNLPLRKELLERLEALSVPLPALVHPAAFVSPSARIAPGALVLPGAVVHANATVGKGAIVSAGAVVDHDASLGDFAHLDAGAVLAARASVPPLTKVPAGTRILPYSAPHAEKPLS